MCYITGCVEFIVMTLIQIIYRMEFITLRIFLNDLLVRCLMWHNFITVIVLMWFFLVVNPYLRHWSHILHFPVLQCGTSFSPCAFTPPKNDALSDNPNVAPTFQSILSHNYITVIFCHVFLPVVKVETVVLIS